MTFLIDTCVISELIRKSPDSGVLNWISNVDEDLLYISVLTLGELKKGISKLNDSKKKSELSDWFNELENRFIQRIISIDKTIAELWGFTQARLEKEGKSMPVIDGLIACSALSNGLAVVTRNGKDMIMSGVEIINPWS